MQIGSLKYELQHTHIYKELRKLKLWKRGWQRARESLTMTLAAALCEQAGVYSENPRNTVHQSGSTKEMGEKGHAKIFGSGFLYTEYNHPLVVSLRPLFFIQDSSWEDTPRARAC